MGIGVRTSVQKTKGPAGGPAGQWRFYTVSDPDRQACHRAMPPPHL